ncbi:MAG: Signal transduction histidine kinase [Verrucomicrobia bacterium]|nr:MAG: Signal transduction histidine kinase [Verrucomicrobiota bacterium]
MLAFAGELPLWAVENQIREVAFLEDPSGEMTFAQVLESEPTVYQGLLSCGYSASSWWVRVTLGAPPKPTPLVLSVWPQFLDEIALFDPQNPAAAPVFGGDCHPPNPAEPLALLSNFTLQPSDAEGRQYWLKVRSTSSVLMELSAYPVGQTQAASGKVDFFNSLYLGFLLCSVIWAGTLAFVQKDTLVWVFAIKQLLHFLHFSLLFGYIRFWFPEWAALGGLNLATNLAVVTLGAWAIWFHYLFLSLHKGNVWVLRVLCGLLLTYPVELGLILYDNARPALHTRMCMNLLATLLVLLASLWIPRRIAIQRAHQCLPRSAVVLFYGFICLVVGATMLPLLKAGIGQGYVRYSFSAEGLMTGVVMLGLIQWRSHKTQVLSARKVYKTAEFSRRLKVQREKNREQQQFISMLAHELKTPLSVVRLSLGAGGASPRMRAFADQAIQDISGIIERCVRSVELESEAPVVLLEPCDLARECAALRERVEEPARLVVGEIREFPGFQTDLSLFRIIVGNLIDNAFKYGHPSEPITVAVAQESRNGKQGVSLVVASLVGVAGLPDPLRVFEKFYRAPGAQRSAGAGLGLYLVHGLTQLLGGSITYRPTADQAVFKLWLPDSFL